MNVTTGSRLRAGLTVGVLAATVATVLLGWTAPALAHNQLVGSDPADEDTVETGPTEIQLTFLASLAEDASEVDVTGPDGASMVTGDPEFDGASVTVPVDAPLAGVYEISYNVLSNDGHWVDGTIEFTVTAGEPPPSPTPSPTPEPEPVAPTPSAPAAPEPEATSGDGDGLPWWVWLLAAVVLAGGGAATYLVSRRRRAAA